MYILLFYFLFDAAKLVCFSHSHNPIPMSFYIPNVWYMAQNQPKSWSVLPSVRLSLCESPLPKNSFSHAKFWSIFLHFRELFLYLCERFREVTPSRHKKEFFLLFCSRFYRNFVRICRISLNRECRQILGIFITNWFVMQ